MADVFISYAREVRSFVQDLYEALPRQGRTWVDWRSIPPIEEWLKEVHAGIETGGCGVSGHRTVRRPEGSCYPTPPAGSLG